MQLQNRYRVKTPNGLTIAAHKDDAIKICESFAVLVETDSDGTVVISPQWERNERLVISRKGITVR